ncbi:MAG: GntR family transcriptional regulator [Clostridia bacterium]|nr:GntR family transcriptional regulator [Clostridia bacterium]
MISFDNFIQTDGVPIYLAIIRHIERGAAAGIVKNGDELPSRRMLSALLGVNPNTIQKAYRILEEDGLVVSHSGAKSVMTLDDEKISRIRRELIAADAGDFIRSMTAMGLSKSETLSLLDRLWKE